jgi:hypothetical protein
MKFHVFSQYIVFLLRKITAGLAAAVASLELLDESAAKSNSLLFLLLCRTLVFFELFAYLKYMY